MIKRLGLTLLEVLISIFIMGIGMLGVLAMFPAAADMMGRAISNAQMAEGLVNARGMQDGVDWTSSAYSSLITINSPMSPGWNSPTVPGGEVPVFLLLDQYAAPSVSKFNNLQIEVGSINSGNSGIAGRFFTSNSDLILNKSGVANLDDDGNSVTVEREAKFTIAHFFTKPMPISNPNYIKRNLIVFKDRSQVITSNDFTYYPISSVVSANQFLLPVNANGIFKTRQWVMVTDKVFIPTNLVNSYPSAVDFFEVRTVDESSGAPLIEISPSLPSTGFGAGPKSVYLLKDVAKVIYSGY